MKHTLLHIRRWPFLRPLIQVYLGFLVAFHLASALQDWWPLRLIAVFYPWLYAPAALLALAAGLSKRWRLAGLAAAPLLIFALAYGGRFLPRSPGARPVSLRVMTWNVRFDTTDAQAMSAAIRAEQPDVLAIQELGTPLAARLADQLRPDYPYQALYPSITPDGFGVFSRYPLAGGAGPELAHTACRCQQVAIELAGGPVTLLNVHPHTPVLRAARAGPLPIPVDFSTAQQDPTFAALQDRIRSIAGPLLVAGDLNTTERQPNYGRLRALLGDAYLEAGWGLGLTYPAGGKLGPLPGTPLLRLDYILHSADWLALRAAVGPAHGSDHRYVVADLYLQRSASPGR